MKLTTLLIFAGLAVAPSAFASHIFSTVTVGGTPLSESGITPTLVEGPSVTFATTITGQPDQITFDFQNPNIPDFSFSGVGPVSFSQLFLPVFRRAFS